MNVLVVIDLDGTLAEPIEPGERYWSWRMRVERGRVAALATAQAVVPKLPAGLDVMVTSCRMESLRGPTDRWVRVHFPRLAGAPLFLREQGDRQDPWAVKLEHMQAARAGRRIVLVDDDPAVKHALFPGDVFLLAPRKWSQLLALVDPPGVKNI